MEDNTVKWMDKIPKMGYSLQIQIPAHGIVIGSASLPPTPTPIACGLSEIKVLRGLLPDSQEHVS